VSIKVKRTPTIINGFIQLDDHHDDDDSHSEIESSSIISTSSLFLGEESVLLGNIQHQQSTSSSLDYHH
jgi:hypothetical protein